MTRSSSQFLVVLIALSATVLCSDAVELTPDNWDELTFGKNVFIKFFAPWCTNSAKMKPDWDKLMADFEGSETHLIGEVDCEGDGKELCSTHRIHGYPTIKYGDPTFLRDYDGQRKYDDMKKYADETLSKPVCGVTNYDLCTDVRKQEIDRFRSMSDAELDAVIAEQEQKLKNAEAEFEAGIKELEEEYVRMASAFKALGDAKTDKDQRKFETDSRRLKQDSQMLNAIKLEKAIEVKAAGLPTMKAVKYSRVLEQEKKDDGKDEL